MKLLASLALFGMAFAAPQTRPAQGTVTAIRHWSLGEVTRVAVEVSQEFEYRLDRLHNPERVYFDILNARPGIGGKGAYSEQVGDKLVSRIRVAETAPGVTRIVLDLAQSVEISTSQLTNPSRLVVELRYTPATVTTALATPPLPKPELPKSTPPALEPPPRNEPVTAEPSRSQRKGSGPERASAATEPSAEPAKPSAKGRGAAEKNLPAERASAPAVPPADAAKLSARSRAAAEKNLASEKETGAGGPSVEPVKPQSKGPASSEKNLGAERASAPAIPPADTAKLSARSRAAAEKNLASEKETGAGGPSVEPVKPQSKGPAASEKNLAAERASAPAVPPADAAKLSARSRAAAEKNLASEKETGAGGPSVEPVKLPSKGTGAEKNLPIERASATSDPSAELPRSPVRSAPLEKIPSLEVAEPPAPAPILPAETGRAARPTTSGSTSLVRALGLKIGRIVIDPGHGGHDQGTQGPKGLIEKEVVLDVALRLGKLVEDKLGAEVVYTRSDDTFIPLEGRTALANEKKADLFLSIHANSSPVARITGVETYYLNFTDAKDAMDVASRENASYEKSVFELQDIIKKIALHEKLEESREFAGRVQTALYQLSNRSIPASKNRGVRKAPFVVLIGARMPSVLAEIGFLSNAREEALLKKPDYRQKLAEALFRGLQRYAESLSHFQVAQAKD